jgi:hypothetical protein
MVAVRWGGTMEVRNGDKEVNGKWMSVWMTESVNECLTDWISWFSSVDMKYDQTSHPTLL